ncbi:MAG: alpha-ketoacid dehydrogenase subunit beta [Chloroflexi bacterium]|nr:alpha-ketoacid dehydrogenase subunit beta [Chloroflexota bacterium]
MAVITYREAIRQAISEEMERDPKVFIMGEEVGIWGGTYAITKGLMDQFGDKRVRDTPISEAAIVGGATGAALAGLRPIAELMTINFGLVAMDAIVNEAPKYHYMFGGQMTVPLTIRAVGGGGRQLAATHSQTLDVIFAYFPGLKVVLPATPYDAKGLLKAAIRDDNPVLYIEHSLLYPHKGEVPDEDYLVPLGKANVMRQGSDVTIVSYSRMAQISLEAAEALSQEGIEAEIVDLRSLRPLDMETVLDSFRKTFRCVIVEEGWKSYGVGAEISTRIYEEAFDYIDAPIKRVAGAEVPMPYARNLEQLAIPSKDDVIQAVHEVLGIA